MDVLEAIYKRRSVKEFDRNFVIPAEDEHKLLEAMIQAPTSFNIQHWRFCLLKSPELRRKISIEFGGGQSQMTDASLLVLFAADVKAWAKGPDRYWSNATEKLRDVVVPAIGPFHEGRERYQRDEAQRSIGMAMQTLMVAAQGLGYESCPMIGFDHDKVSEVVKLPADYVIGPMVAIGKGTKDPWPKPGQLPLGEVVVTDSF